MNRMLMLGTFALSLAFAACATQVDDSVTDEMRCDTGIPHPAHIEVVEGFRQSGPSYLSSNPSTVGAEVSDAAADGEVVDHYMGTRLPPPAVVAGPGWDELLTCVQCVAERYKMQVPVGPAAL